MPATRVRSGHGMGLPERLEQASHKAMDVLNEGMGETNDDPDLVALHRMRNEAAKTIITTQRQVDDAALRMKQQDDLNEMLQLVLKRKAELAQEGDL